MTAQDLLTALTEATQNGIPADQINVVAYTSDEYVFAEDCPHKIRRVEMHMDLSNHLNTISLQIDAQPAGFWRE